MDFMSNLENKVGVETENGAIVYKNSNKPLVDLNYMVGSMRKLLSIFNKTKKADQNISRFRRKFMEAFAEDPFYTTIWLFYLRDPRNGLGERDLFRILFTDLAESKKNMNFIPLLECVFEHGRIDDFIKIGCRIDIDETVRVIDQTIQIDLKRASEDKSISLLAKWMPSINTSSRETVRLAKDICRRSRLFRDDYHFYAKTLKKLREYLKVVETRMSENRWYEINYSEVPSKANVIYGKAFLRHDAKRREKFIKDVSAGKAKVNTSTLFPYEVVRMVQDNNYDNDYINAIWNKLPAPKKKLKNTVVFRDGSSSMFTNVSGHTTAMDIGDALTLYIAKYSEGCFHNKFITFSNSAEVVDIDPDDLCGAMYVLRSYDSYNTDIVMPFQAVLETAMENGLSQEELPDKVIVISDMEFDDVVTSSEYDDTISYHSRNRVKLFDYLENMYEEEGYKLPHLVFWNVNNRTGGIPKIENEKGLTLMSGFSARAFDMLLSEKLDPWVILREVLDNPVFSDVAKEVVV